MVTIPFLGLILLSGWLVWGCCACCETRDQGTISPYKGGRFVPWSDDECCPLVVRWLSLGQIVGTVRFLRGRCGGCPLVSVGCPLVALKGGVRWLSLGRECLFVSFDRCGSLLFVGLPPFVG